MDRGQPLVQAEPGGAQRRATIVGEGAPHGEAVSPRRPRRLVVAPLAGALNRSHPAHRFLEQHLGVPVGLDDRFGRLPQIVERAQLLGWD